MKDERSPVPRPCSSVNRFGGCTPNSGRRTSEDQIAGLVAAGIISGLLVSLLVWYLWRRFQSSSRKGSTGEQDGDALAEDIPSDIASTSTADKDERLWTE